MMSALKKGSFITPSLNAHFFLVSYTVEPLNKGHLRTEAIVPYSEVVPYLEVFQRK